MTIEELLKLIDEGTTAAGQRVDEQGKRLGDLITSIKARNIDALTDAQAAEASALVSNLGAIGAHLSDIGKEPEAPVPPAPPLASPQTGDGATAG